MKVTFDDKGVLAGIIEEIEAIPGITAEHEKEALKDIGKVIAKHVKAKLPIEYLKQVNYDGSMPYVHMRDDVKTTVRQDKAGYSSVTIHGGKKTAFKWHILDDGTRNKDGTVHTPAIHFTQNAMKASEIEVDKIIDRLVEEVASDTGRT